MSSIVKLEKNHEKCRCPKCREYAAVKFNDGTYECFSSNVSPVCAFYGKMDDETKETKEKDNKN